MVSFRLLVKVLSDFLSVFYFTCINPETNKIVEVLGGRFDIKYDNWF